MKYRYVFFEWTHFFCLLSWKHSLNLQSTEHVLNRKYTIFVPYFLHPFSMTFVNNAIMLYFHVFYKDHWQNLHFFNNYWKLFRTLFKIIFRIPFFRDKRQIYEASVEFAQVWKRLFANSRSKRSSKKERKWIAKTWLKTGNFFAIFISMYSYYIFLSFIYNMNTENIWRKVHNTARILFFLSIYT